MDVLSLHIGNGVVTTPVAGAFERRTAGGADGKGRFGDALELDLAFSAHGLDARAFSTTAPKTSLDAQGTLRGRLPERSRPSAELALETKPSRVAETTIPAVTSGTSTPIASGTRWPTAGWLLEARR